MLGDNMLYAVLYTRVQKDITLSCGLQRRPQLRKMEHETDDDVPCPWSLTRPPTPEPVLEPAFVFATHLVQAVQRNNVEQVELLLSEGHPVNQPSGNNATTALLASVDVGDHEVCRMLLDAGAKPNQADSKGNTPVLAAYCIGRRDLLCLLVEQGASIVQKNNAGQCVEDLVFLNDDLETFMLLAKPNLVKAYTTGQKPVRILAHMKFMRELKHKKVRFSPYNHIYG